MPRRNVSVTGGKGGKKKSSQKKRKPAPWETAPLASPAKSFTLKPLSLSQRDMDHLLASRSVDFSGLNLEALDLSFADLSGSAWYGTSLAQTVLSSSRFRGVDAGYGMLKVERTRFDRTVMSGTSYRFTHFDDCLFVEPEIGNAHFENVRMSTCQFQNTSFHNTTIDNSGLAPSTNAWFELRGYGVSFEGCTLKKLTLGSSFFHSARIANSTLTGCCLDRLHFPASLCALSAENLNFLECEIDQLWCPGSNLKSLRLERTNLVLPYLDGAHVQGVFLKFKIEGGSSIGTRFNHSVFTNGTFGTKIVPSDFSRASFDHCSFSRVSFVNCRLSDATWTGVDLSQVSFRDCIDAPL